jgi:hypothetical protein
VCGGHNVGTGLVNRGMDAETCSVDGKLNATLSYITLWIDEDKVGRQRHIRTESTRLKSWTFMLE